MLLLAIFSALKGRQEKWGTTEKYSLKKHTQLSPILLYRCIRSIPPVKQLAIMYMVLGWQLIFLLEGIVLGECIHCIFSICAQNKCIPTYKCTTIVHYHCSIV